jgi:hypothetical protein
LTTNRPPLIHLRWVDNRQVVGIFLHIDQKSGRNHRHPIPDNFVVYFLSGIKIDSISIDNDTPDKIVVYCNVNFDASRHFIHPPPIHPSRDVRVSLCEVDACVYEVDVCARKGVYTDRKNF